MPEKRKKKRRGMSAGSWLALLLTGAVLASCFVFLSRIAGEYMDAKTVLHTLTNTLELPALRAQKHDEPSSGGDTPTGTSVPTLAPQATPTRSSTARE